MVSAVLREMSRSVRCGGTGVRWGWAPVRVVGSAYGRRGRGQASGSARRRRQVDGGEVGDGEQFGEGLQLAALLRFQLADRRVVAEGQFAGGGGGGQAADGPVAQQDDAGAQGLRLLDPVAEEVVGVGAGGEVAGEQHAVGGQGLGEFGGEGRAAGEFGEDGGEAAARGARGGALGPDQRERVGELGGEGLGRVAVRGDGRAAALGGAVEPVGDLLQGLRRARRAGRRGRGATSSGVSRAHSAPGPAATSRRTRRASRTGRSPSVRTRPCAPSTASASGEPAGATATTVQPRR